MSKNKQDNNTVKTPSKPKPSEASIEELLACYNSQVPLYNMIVARLSANTTVIPENLKPMAIIRKNIAIEQLDRDWLIKAIRRQNRRLGRTVRRRALELLEARVKGPDGRPMTDEDGRSIGLKYKEVLSIIKKEFPEASTSVACLRWYVVHLRMDANDEGKPWPDLPQIRPRTKDRTS